MGWLGFLTGLALTIIGFNIDPDPSNADKMTFGNSLIGLGILIWVMTLIRKR